MKRIVFIAMLAIIAGVCSNCTQTNNSKNTPLNTNSVKAVVMGIHQQMMAARDKNTEQGNQEYASFCDDSLMGSDLGIFFASATDIAHDLSNGSIVSPHDFIFRLLGNTAFLSYIEKNYELVGWDTIIQYAHYKSFCA